MRKELKLLIIFLLVSIKINAQEKISANQGYVENKKYFNEIQYEDRNGKIIINVQIENKSYRFLLDTGAATAISEKLQSSIKLQKLGNIKMTDQSGLTDSLEVVSVSEINIDGIKFRNIPAFVAKSDSDIFFPCLEIEGIIGSNLLRNSTIQFRPKEKKIILTDKSKNLKLKKRNAVEMIVTQNQSSPIIPIKLIKDNQVGNEFVLFDTGDKDFYVSSNRSYTQLQSQVDIYDIIAKSIGTFSVGFFGTASENEHLLLKIPNLRIGNIDFHNVFTKTTYDETSRIGSELLKYGNITLDYKKKRFWFESFQRNKTIKLNEKPWPIEPVLNNQNEIVVGIIWDESLIDKINVGDKILKFGNINYESMSHCEIMNSTFNVENSEAILIYQDKDTRAVKELKLNRM